MASKAYDAGVKEYRDMYWTPEYVPLDTDLLACFKCTRVAFSATSVNRWTAMPGDTSTHKHASPGTGRNPCDTVAI